MIDGIEYLTTRQLCDRLGSDITPDRINDWVRCGWLHPVTKGEMAAALRQHLPAGADPTDPVRLNRQNVYRWVDAQKVEARTARSRRGNTRRLPAVA